MAGLLCYYKEVQEPLFDLLKPLYLANGFRLYIVGGTARDLLLNRPHDDFDFATSATPEEEKAFLPYKTSYVFSKFGAVRAEVESQKVDLTTLREEKGYDDHRHPQVVVFVKDPSLDYRRRDFTINALYLDEEYQILDFVGGMDDLKNKLIRFVGDPTTRIKEDPLRIIRAERFASTLGFGIEEKSLEAITKYRYLLKELNPEKIKEEERKGWIRK